MVQLPGNHVDDGAACPFCGRRTAWVHATTSQRKKDRRIWDRPLILVLRKRRFRCFPCHKVFSEADPVFGFRRRSTVRLRQHVARRAAFQPVAQVARQEGVSPSLVRRSFAETYRPRLAELLNHPQTSPILGLDEFSRARGRLETVVYDPEGGGILGLIPGNGSNLLRAYLEKLPDPDRVRVVTMDMHDAFRQTVQLCLPYARVVVDKFHFLRMVHRALDQVRVAWQGKGHDRTHDALFHARRLLLKAKEKLSFKEEAKLETLFRLFPALKTAWQLKEGLREWYHSATWREALDGMGEWLGQVRRSWLEPFRALLGTFREWGEEILNYFSCRVTNGPLEGKNNRIKVIKRLGYGYRNADNLRIRIHLTNRSQWALA
ncbi:MAG: ISL3 family transposase [Coprothermobacterota bacterium]|nr:ISL3 family transposase [Coprothermobacterota bacterium]